MTPRRALRRTWALAVVATLAAASVAGAVQSFSDPPDSSSAIGTAGGAAAGATAETVPDTAPGTVSTITLDPPASPDPAPRSEMARRVDPPSTTEGAAATSDGPRTTGVPAPPVAEEAATAAAAGADCLVFLHGKGGRGAATRDVDGVRHVAPSGNAAGWGGRQWTYDDDASFAQARAIVRRSVDDAGCGHVVIHGFSNGGAFAARLYCRGESLGGRLVRVVVDDPVTDAGVRPCGPAGGVATALYWTGALAATAPAGWSCAVADWTCAGGSSIGIDAYAAALGVAPLRSPMGGHASYDAAPELTRF